MDDELAHKFQRLALTRPRFLTRLRPRRLVAAPATPQRPRAVAFKGVRLEREVGAASSSTRREPPARSNSSTTSPAVRKSRSGAASPDAAAGARRDDSHSFAMAQRYLEQRLRPRTRSLTRRQRAASL